MGFYLIDGNANRIGDVRYEYDTWREMKNEVTSILEDYAAALEKPDGKRKSKRADDAVLAVDVRDELAEWQNNNVWSSHLPYKVTIGDRYIEVGNT